MRASNLGIVWLWGDVDAISADAISRFGYDGDTVGVWAVCGATRLERFG